MTETLQRSRLADSPSTRIDAEAIKRIVAVDFGPVPHSLAWSLHVTMNGGAHGCCCS